MIPIVYAVGWLFAYGLYRNPLSEEKWVDISASAVAATLWPIAVPYTAGSILRQLLWPIV